MRRYEHGSAWAFWRWTDVDWLGETYLRRLHLVKTPWFAVMLHWIKGPDPHPDPHDHPVSFLSVTLRGGYDELLPDLGLVWKRVRYRRASDVHRIVYAEPGTLTLVLAGPVVRRWGFETPDGWIDWKTYRNAHARQ